MWELLFAADAEQHATLYGILLPHVPAFSLHPRAKLLVSYMLTYATTAQREQIRAALHSLGLRARQCSCGHYSVESQSEAAAPGGDRAAGAETDDTWQCGVCATLPTAGARATVQGQNSSGNALREQRRYARLLAEHARLNPDNCTAHSLEQLAKLAGTTAAVAMVGPGRTNRAVWEGLGRFIEQREVVV